MKITGFKIIRHIKNKEYNTEFGIYEITMQSGTHYILQKDNEFKAFSNFLHEPIKDCLNAIRGDVISEIKQLIGESEVQE